MAKQEENGTQDLKKMEEMLFERSPQGKRNKWEQIKSMPEMEEFVRLVSEVFGPPTNVKVFKRDRRMEKL
jgi:hypothetical protein